MSVKILDLHTPSPLLFRDGKPFNAAGGTETAAQSLPVPLPSTLAGFIRTQIGIGSHWSWNQHDLEKTHTIPVAGLLTRDQQLVFSAPRDAVVYKDKDSNLQIIRLAPLEKLEDAAGTDAPGGMTPMNVPANLKAETGYALWTQADIATWLKGETPNAATLEPIAGLPLETRVHVGIDSTTGAADDGQLFSVAYRSFESTSSGQHHRWGIRARVKLPDGTRVAPLGHFGGERRVATLAQRTEDHLWRCPEDLRAAILGSTHLKLTLATPAIFTHGWKPAWLESTDSANMPKGLFDAGLELIGAAVGRREPVSGWNIRENQAKAVRYMVPAGSVYFFKTPEGKQKQILENWLKPVSDNEQDRKDGFGLALWGVWQYD
jgi:CRISPR-associated protein Cmr3